MSDIIEGSLNESSFNEDSRKKMREVISKFAEEISVEKVNLLGDVRDALQGMSLEEMRDYACELEGMNAVVIRDKRASLAVSDFVESVCKMGDAHKDGRWKEGFDTSLSVNEEENSIEVEWSWALGWSGSRPQFAATAFISLPVRAYISSEGTSPSIQFEYEKEVRELVFIGGDDAKRAYQLLIYRHRLMMNRIKSRMVLQLWDHLRKPSERKQSPT